MYQILEQFEVYFLGSIFDQIILNNAMFYIFLIAIVFIFICNRVLANLKNIPWTFQFILENIFNFLLNLIKQQMSMHGYLYFPLIFTLFITLFSQNLIGLALFSYTVTSQIIITFTLSFSFFIAIILIGIIVQKTNFIDTFIPSGAPKIIKPFLIVIEIISYISRPFSLGIRLFANIMAGHSLLYILGMFAIWVYEKNILVFLLPCILILAIIGLELMICVLQAYVFTILVCIYYNDSLHGSH